jgi:multicomponent Na+:H+ antiporter subunit A
LLAVLASPFDPRLGRWFGQESVPAAHGQNVVNVILVDFRALDTLGEITVLAIAAFAIVALLRISRLEAPR